MLVGWESENGAGCRGVSVYRVWCVGVDNLLGRYILLQSVYLVNLPFLLPK